MKRILIIEDDALTATIYRGILEKEGYQVAVATDGQTGYDQLIESKPDGVLVDLMLPKINGADLVKRIRAVDGFQKLPIIAYTNAFIAATVEPIRAAGANHVLDKATVTPTLLLTLFRETIAAKARAQAA